MTLTHLRTFHAVAELQHFAKAAAQRNLSQPAVSHQIAQLEQLVGARLFNRTGRRVSLTVVGEILLEETRRVLSALDRAEERVREAAQGVIGRIRFGASPTAGLYLLASLFVHYRQRHPYELHVDIDDEAALLDRVARNDLDMAVVACDIPMAELQAWPLADDALLAVAPPGAVAAARRRVDARDLLRDVWIMREPGSDTRRRVDLWLQHQHLTPARTLTVAGPAAVKRAVEAGLGIGVLSARCVKADIQAGRLVHVPIDPSLPTRQYRVVDHRHKHHGAACRAMLAELRRFTDAASTPHKGRRPIGPRATAARKAITKSTAR